MTAVNLARLSDAPLTVTVLNRGTPLARGVAYGTPRSEHLLNVVARNMSALADQPDHFIDWLGTRSDFASIPTAELRERFVPRRVFGDYLQALFLWYSHALDDGKEVVIKRHEVEAVDVVPSAGRATVIAAGGLAFEADKVVLATGNQRPTDLPGCALDDPRYFRDPWGDWAQRLGDRRQDVIILGTSLTMVDAFLTLAALGWEGKVTAVSRNGLLPQSHFKSTDYPAFPDGDPSHQGLDEMLALIDVHCERAARSRPQSGLAGGQAASLHAADMAEFQSGGQTPLPARTPHAVERRAASRSPVRTQRLDRCAGGRPPGDRQGNRSTNRCRRRRA